MFLLQDIEKRLEVAGGHNWVVGSEYEKNYNRQKKLIQIVLKISF
jgi:hypothetical protein